MKFIKLSLVTALSALLFLYFFLGTSEPPKSSHTRISTAPIVDAPEWLKVLFEEVITSDSLCVWVPTGIFESSSLIKVPRFPRKFTPQEIKENSNLNQFNIQPISSEHTLQANVVKNERFSGQIAIAARQDITNLQVSATKLSSANEDEIPLDQIQVRYVGYVPVQRGASEFTWSAKYEEVAGPEVSGTMMPDVVADPLFALNKTNIPSHQVQPVWFSIDIPESTKPGVYTGTISIQTDQFPKQEFIIELNVIDLVLPDIQDYSFFLDMWLNANALSDQYQVPTWSEEHWVLIKKYMQELASGGGKTITTIITHEPWRIPWTNHTMRSQTHSGFEGMIKWKRTSEGTWLFDYSIFDRYVETAMESGLNERINAYSLTTFRGKEKMHYYEEKEQREKEIFFDSINVPEYRNIWKIFLADFKNHLKRKGWLDKTYLCFDERPNETMQYITKMIKELAPEFSNRIAISGHPESAEFATGFLSMSYEFFPDQNLSKQETLQIIKNRNQTGQLTTFYLCGQPAHPNTFSFSPAIESRMIPWLALKYQTQGLLRWSFNSWPEQPFKEPVFNFIQGDEYIIYPGESGPISSIRWELLKDGIEDFELFILIEEKAESNSLLKLLEKAVSTATQNEDGRLKNVKDIEKARNLLFRHSAKLLLSE